MSYREEQMSYREELRKRISKWTSLRGIEVDNILNALQEKNVDPYTIDWKTLGEEIKDFGDRYQATWDWLSKMYGIGKPVYIGLKIDKEEEIYREGEQLLYNGIDGIRELLNRIYSGDISVEEERIYRDIILGGGLPYVTDLALYNGSEKGLAKKFLIEEVIKKPVETVEEKELEEEIEEEIEEENLEEELYRLVEEKEKYRLKQEQLDEIKRIVEEINPDIEVVEVKQLDGGFNIKGVIKPEYKQFFIAKYENQPIIGEGENLELAITDFNYNVSRRHKKIPVTGKKKSIVGMMPYSRPKIYVGEEILVDYFYQHACPHILKSFDPEAYRKTGVLLCKACENKGMVYSRTVEEGKKLAGIS